MPSRAQHIKRIDNLFADADALLSVPPSTPGTENVTPELKQIYHDLQVEMNKVFVLDGLDPLPLRF